MTFIPNQSLDYYTEVRKGNVNGASMVHKFGRNDSVPNGSWEFVTLLGQTAHALSAATTVRIKSGGNAADTAAGAGAREVTVQGIEAVTFDQVSEAIATAGAAVSTATTKSFWRVHRAWVSGVGTYGAANTGDVDIENGAGGTDIMLMAAGEGQSQDCVFSIPDGKTGYLVSVHVTVDSSKPADVRVFIRENLDDTTAPMTSRRLKKNFDGISGSYIYKPVSPNSSIAARGDIWVEARGAGGSTEVSVDMEILLIDD